MLRVAGATALLVGAGAVGTGVVWGQRNLHTFDRDWGRALDAGWVQRDVTVEGVRWNYLDLPGSTRPTLVLLHGQGVDAKDFAPVIPALSERFRVVSIDVPGHGGTDRTPGRYRATEQAEMIAQTITQIVDGPCLLAGHSSGGQLAALVAAQHPELVRAVLLEDPPMFTTPLPRARTTWNYLDLATTCHEFLASGEGDWVAYQWVHQRMWEFFGGIADRIREDGLAHHRRHPEDWIRLWYLPPFATAIQRGMLHYDPRFGDAFYTGEWDAGFDHEATLRAIDVPSIFVHTKVQHRDGVLLGASEVEDARRAVDALPAGRLVQVDTGHGFHGEDPDRFVALIEELDGLSS